MDEGGEKWMHSENILGAGLMELIMDWIWEDVKMGTINAK